MRILLLIFSLGTFLQPAISQTIEMGELKAEGGQVKFYFIVNKKSSDRERYHVKIFTSKDNFTRPLPKTFTDVVPGEVVNVALTGADGLSGFSGELKIALEAEATVFPVSITNMPKKLKKGKSFTLGIASNTSGPYKVDLKGSDGKIRTLDPTWNGSSKINLPKDLEKGKGYELTVEPANKRTERSEVQSVQVSSGSLWMPIGGGAATVGVVALLLSMQEKEGGDLPLPPSNPDDFRQ